MRSYCRSHGRYRAGCATCAELSRDYKRVRRMRRHHGTPTKDPSRLPAFMERTELVEAIRALFSHRCYGDSCLHLTARQRRTLDEWFDRAWGVGIPRARELIGAGHAAA